jgi:vacuolar-type H+-ATPase subunit H
MSISPKHLATFLLGAAAGAAIVKYKSMSPEEQEAMVSDLKEKANTVKTEAEVAVEKLVVYFEDLKTKGMEALKTQMGEAESMINDILQKPNNSETPKA